MKLKVIALSTLAAFAAILPASAADVTAKISNVHLCCKSCVTGVEKAVGKVSGATAAVDKDAGTVSLTAGDAPTLQKAVNALIAAGYYGSTTDSNIKLATTTGAKNAKVQTLKVEGVHLCCAKCVTAVDETLKAIPGVKSHTAEKNAKSFEVTGDFNDQEVFAGLQKAGLTGSVAK